MRNYRQPTEKEAKKLEEARKKTVEGIEGEKDLLSKISTTMAKSARDEIRAGKAMRESVPAAAREGEAYNQAGLVDLIKLIPFLLSQQHLLNRTLMP